MVGWMEYTAKMEGKMFAAYHYAISPVVFFWQCQATTLHFVPSCIRSVYLALVLAAGLSTRLACDP